MSGMSYLISGEDHLASKGNFELVGREEELNSLISILMQKGGSNVILSGPSGVGASALATGLQAAKNNPDAPFDVLRKSHYWLDIDELFRSGDHAAINEAFDEILKFLGRSPDNVLHIEDMRDFVDGVRNAGSTNMINGLMKDIRKGKFQAVFETRDSDLDVVLKCHSDMIEYYTLFDLKEPSGEKLETMLRKLADGLEAHHGIPVSDEAIKTAIEMTSKYRVQDIGLSRAQPQRAYNLLDRAMTTYRKRMHSAPQGVAEREASIEAIKSHIDNGTPVPKSYAGHSKEELAATVLVLQEEAQAIQGEWDDTHAQIKKLAESHRKGENMLADLQDELAVQREADAERRKAEENGEEAAEDVPAVSSSFQSFASRMAAGGMESPEVAKILEEIRKVEDLVKQNKGNLDKVTAKINEGLELTAAEVTNKFSEISGIPANKLNEDERETLISLNTNLKKRVFGQDQAVNALSDAVIVARTGLVERNKPQAAFLFPGPSGVGKTELSKALAEALKGDEGALFRLDMSEYMEKHAVAKLIGAPPGYEGFEAGGILTNAVRQNPHRIILFDEIEKAHPDVFNVLLQVLDDARLTDNVGRTVSFENTIIVMTTNIGQPHFLAPGADFDQASEATMEELGTVYRPEFLNRFNGRKNIICFDKLSKPVIERIAGVNIAKLNKLIAANGGKIHVQMSEETISALVDDLYSPAEGARGIPGYFNSQIKPAVGKSMLHFPDNGGTMEVTYDPETKRINVSELKGDDDAVAVDVANQNFSPAAA